MMIADRFVVPSFCTSPCQAFGLIVQDNFQSVPVEFGSPTLMTAPFRSSVCPLVPLRPIVDVVESE